MVKFRGESSLLLAEYLFVFVWSLYNKKFGEMRKRFGYIERQSENEDSDFVIKRDKATYKKWEEKENLVYVQFLQ